MLVLSVFILAFGFFLSVKNHQLFTELGVFHAKLFSNLNEASKAVDVILVVLIDVFIDL